MINKEDGITEIVELSCQLLWQFESLLRYRFKRRILFKLQEDAAFHLFLETGLNGKDLNKIVGQGLVLTFSNYFWSRCQRAGQINPELFQTGLQ